MIGMHINLQQKESLTVTLCASCIHAAAGIVSAFPFPQVCFYCHCSTAKASLESKAGTLWF